MATIERFERREYKYLIPNHLAGHIRRSAQINCSLDAYAGPDGIYRIRSLYLDNRNRDLYWANEREQARRFKARIRSYPGTKAPFFLEIKGRELDVIVKNRVKMSRNTWREMTDSRYPQWNLLKGADHFIRRVIAHHLEPVCLVEYEREAYISHTEVYGRLTFDSFISCQYQKNWSLNAEQSDWRLIDNRATTGTSNAVCVLELKFENAAPRWMVNLVQRYNLMRYSFSKYCYSIDALGLRPEGLNRAPARRSPWSG